MNLPEPSDGLQLIDVAWLPLSTVVTMSCWAGERAIYLGQTIIRVGYNWLAWAERKRKHARRP